MNVSRWAVAAFLVCGVAGAQESRPPRPVSTNPDDAPPRVKSGKVFPSTDVSVPPALGPLPAKVLVIVFSDFQCPVCKRSADATQQIADEFPGEVRVEFWQHALAMHSQAEGAAVASLAAQRQGMFWEYHDELFRNQSTFDSASLARYAEQVGMDVEKFKTDVEDPELRARVKSESAAADRFGAPSTPSFMINGKVKVGWGSWYAFRADVERELNEARKLEAAGTPVADIAALRAQALIEDPERASAYRELVVRAAPKPAPVADDSSTKPSKKKKKKKG